MGFSPDGKILFSDEIGNRILFEDRFYMCFYYLDAS